MGVEMPAPKHLQVNVPGPLHAAVEVAAKSMLGSVAAYTRYALVEQLRRDHESGLLAASKDK